MLRKFRRDFSIILSTIWINLFALVALILGSAVLLKYFGADPQASWAQLVLDAFNLASMERVETGGRIIPIIMAFLLPIAMALILGEGILRIFSIYTQRHTNRKEWDLMVAQTLREHTVICGAGEMGRQLLQQMMVEKPDMEVILIDPRPGLITELGLNSEQAIHLQADMTDIETLKQANIDDAELVVLSAGEDALNLEAAYKILNINPDITVCIRLHHSGLADLLDLSKKANIHFFCPYQQAAKAIVDHMMGR